MPSFILPRKLCCAFFVVKSFDSTPWIAVLFLAQSGEPLSHVVFTLWVICVNLISGQQLSSSLLHLVFMSQLLWNKPWTDCWMSEVLNYHVDTSSLIQSVVTPWKWHSPQSELIHERVVSCQGWTWHLLCGSLSSWLFPLFNDLTRFAQHPTVLPLIMGLCKSFLDIYAGRNLMTAVFVTCFTVRRHP
jgi:hypothetical protein